MTETRKWSAIAAVLVVAIFVAGWFLLVSPKRADAAKLEAQATSKAADNARLQSQISMLQQQMKDLPQQRADLATLRRQIPASPALPALIRDLTEAGRKAGVTIDSMAPAPPVALVAAAPAVVAAPPASGSGKAAAAPHPATPSSTLFKVPLSLTVTGSYFELEHFVSKLENVQRSFLVGGFTLGAATSEEAVDGDLTIVLDGRVFISQPTPAAATTPVAAAATPTGTEGATS